MQRSGGRTAAGIEGSRGRRPLNAEALDSPIRTTDNLRVVGVDPAPAKGLHIFDGTDQSVPLSESRTYIEDLATRDDVLVCWDAPLTGPPSDVVAGGDARRGAFTQRRIERFFSQSSYGYKAPPGIAVQGYAGCQHWTIGRSLLGYPRVGPHDTPPDELPFSLATSGYPSTGRWIVEVHPALAMWLWLRPVCPPQQDWRYKKNKTLLKYFWSALVEGPLGVLTELASAPSPSSDDVLDARVAYALGRFWVSGRTVTLAGNLDDGTFLLPIAPDLAGALSRHGFEIGKVGSKLGI